MTKTALPDMLQVNVSNTVPMAALLRLVRSMICYNDFCEHRRQSFVVMLWRARQRDGVPSALSLPTFVGAPWSHAVTVVCVGANETLLESIQRMW